MKTMKKLMALVLGLVMMMAMSVTSFADSATTYTITAPSDGHTYEVYQIFTGDLSGKKLSNVVWGANAKETQGTEVSEDILNELAAKGDGSEAGAAYVNFDSTPVATVKDGSTASVVPGYYLIKDKDGTVTGTDTYTNYIIKIVGDVTISPKKDIPSFEKKLKDTNDTKGDTTDWQDSADYDIGDSVPFKLTGTLPDNYDTYKTYYYVFHDKMEKGLTFNKDSVKVYVDGKEITSGYEVVTETSDGDTFDVVFSDLKKVSSVTADSSIVVEYNATLNSDAVCGNQGQLNTGKLEFSNNPNQTGDGTPDTGKTPEDTVIVFTYKVNADKYTTDDEGKEQALKGAAFTLYKEVAEGGETVEGLTEGKKYVVVEAKEAGEATSFEWKGIDDGNYVIVETVTPAGYNSIQPIYFTVEATHVAVKDDLADGNRTQVLTKLDAGSKFTGDVSNGSVSTKIENKSGKTLPETGGMGTTMFYVVGAVLMIGAGVVLITRKRMSSEK